MLQLITHILSGLWQTTAEMAPYLIFGFLVAGMLSVLIPASFVERHLGRGRLLPVIKASMIGIPLPLCSCGVIPVAAGLRKHGSSKAATTAFLMSTPQTGVDSILVTYSLLGPVFAVFRPLAALLSGFFGGMMVLLFDSEAPEPPTDTRSPNERPVTESGVGRRCTDDCCSGGDRGSSLSRILEYGFRTLPRDIGRSLLVGLLLAGLISAALPSDFFAGRLAGGSLLSMLVMMLCGIPVYVCATASVPVAAALMAKGVSPGAALVFLMTGPATNTAAISTIWKTMGRRTAALFLAAVMVSALAAGLALDLVVAGIGAGQAPPPGLMLPWWLKQLSAVFLFLLLLQAFTGPSGSSGETVSGDGEACDHAGDHRDCGGCDPEHDHCAAPRSPAETCSAGRVPKKKSNAAEEKQTAPSRKANVEGDGSLDFGITGMTCSHCEKAVIKALLAMDGVRKVEADARSGSVRVRGAGLDMERIETALRELGHEVVPRS